MWGMEVRVDLAGVREQYLTDGRHLTEVCCEAAIMSRASVLKEAWASLEPLKGCAVSVILREGHISLYTSVDDEMIVINIFICDETINGLRIREDLCIALGGTITFQDTLSRFVTRKTQDW